MITVYVGKNRQGQWKASIDASKINKKLDGYHTEELETVNKCVYLLDTYKGYDYTYNAMGIVNVTSTSPLYHSVCALKKNNETWKQAMASAKAEPQNYHVSDFNIASDVNGSPFTYGDVMEQKFNAQIIGIKLI